MAVLWDELLSAHKSTHLRGPDFLTQRALITERNRRLAKRDALMIAYLIMDGGEPESEEQQEAIYERLEELSIADHERAIAQQG